MSFSNQRLVLRRINQAYHKTHTAYLEWTASSNEAPLYPHTPPPEPGFERQAVRMVDAFLFDCNLRP